ncbi:MAG: DUF2817 domain-containing protein [Bdellovibrionales bacterium]
MQIRYPENIRQAKALFRESFEAIVRAGNLPAEFEQIRIPGTSGPNGEPYTLDVSCLGNLKAPAIKITTIAGTHGPERNGDAVQARMHWQIASGQIALPADRCMVQIRGLSGPAGALLTRPFGKVDLNRAFQANFENLPGPTQFMRDNWDKLVLRDLNPETVARSRAFLDEMFKTPGSARDFLSHFMRGQYTESEGHTYGGAEPPAVRPLLETIAGWFPASQEDRGLDYHTGPGNDEGDPKKERGKYQLFLLTENDSPLHLRGNKIWGAENVRALAAQNNQAASPRVYGPVISLWDQLGTGTLKTMAGAECHSEHNRKLTEMFILRQAFSRLGDPPDHPMRTEILEGIDAAFNPRSPEWRRRAVMGGVHFIKRAIYQPALAA